jgi:cold shock CspA family protein
MIGKIKRLVTDHGYGFVAGEDGKDYFFHLEDMLDRTEFHELSEDDAVEFEPVVPTPAKGQRACDVRRITATEPITGGIHV